jgi:hypothetical protein
MPHSLFVSSTVSHGSFCPIPAQNCLDIGILQQLLDIGILAGRYSNTLSIHVSIHTMALKWPLMAIPMDGFTSLQSGLQLAFNSIPLAVREEPLVQTIRLWG